MKIKFVIFLLIFLVTSSFAMSASLHGTVYDLYLNNQLKTRVEINTVPKQVFISKDGYYSFEVPEGDYTISAKYYDSNLLVSYVEENISIIDNGDYLLDLILFPEIDNLGQDLEVFEDDKKNSFFGLLLLVIVILFVIILISYSFKKVNRMIKEDIREFLVNPEDKVEDGLDKKILDFITLNGGRVLQKDIRRQFPSSEAKISLVLTELEHCGKVKKLKKGRGNIILLQ